MPVLQLKVSPPQHPETYASLAEALTRLSAEHLGKKPELTVVLIDELLAGRWRVNSQVVDTATFYLEISIGTGTNTTAEKDAFIAAAYDEVQRQIGRGQPLEPASYVVVRELAATDWGYGGQTYQARRLAREAASATV